MSLKQKVKAMRVVLGTRPCKHGYDLQQVIGTLYGYIDELESQSDQPSSINVPVGIMNAEVSAGADGKFGTADDSVKVTAAKKKPAAAKRTPAKKKAPAKKAPAKKATKSKSKS